MFRLLPRSLRVAAEHSLVERRSLFYPGAVRRTTTARSIRAAQSARSVFLRRPASSAVRAWGSAARGRIVVQPRSRRCRNVCSTRALATPTRGRDDANVTATARLKSARRHENAPSFAGRLRRLRSALVRGRRPRSTRLPSASAHFETHRDWNLRQTPVVEAVKRVRAAVVNIHSERTVSGQQASNEELLALAPSQSRVNGMGTGIIIDPRGYIITNLHVIDEVSVIRVRLRRHDRHGRPSWPAIRRPTSPCSRSTSINRCRSCRSARPAI